MKETSDGMSCLDSRGERDTDRDCWIKAWLYEITWKIRCWVWQDRRGRDEENLKRLKKRELKMRLFAMLHPIPPYVRELRCIFCLAMAQVWLPWDSWLTGKCANTLRETHLQKKVCCAPCGEQSLLHKLLCNWASQPVCCAGLRWTQ